MRRAPTYGSSIGIFYRMHMMGAIFPITAGLAFYGWRAAMSIAIVVTSAMAGMVIWRRIGKRGFTLRPPHGLWMSLLLALTLPAHLLSQPGPNDHLPLSLWAILPAAGLLLVVLMWVLGGVGSPRFHPVLVTNLLLVLFVGDSLVPHWVLQRSHTVTGDLMSVTDPANSKPSRDGWRTTSPIPRQDGLYVKEPASLRLTLFTTNSAAPALISNPQPANRVAAPPSPTQVSQRATEEMDRLLDGLPALEDLAIGGHPGPIGAGSAIAVIIGGLFLLYRGLIDYRIPLIIIFTAFAAFLVLPLPIVMDNATVWRSLFMPRLGIDGGTAVTFVNYELMASPLLFVAFFLATAPAVRPMARRARTIYALLTGIAAAASQLYLSVSYGPYVALLLVSLLTPLLDRWFASRPLV